MTYAIKDFVTKEAFAEAVRRGERVKLFTSGKVAPVKNGPEYVQGPWPQKGGTLSNLTHRWHATVQVRDGVVWKVE
jgi:hypothetical protein